MTQYNSALTDTNDAGFAPRCVLIVEDSEPDSLIISRQLKKLWPETKVMLAATLEAALAHSHKNYIDLVLLDLNLPDSKGTETVQLFRKANLGACIVVVTGMDADIIDKEAKQFGATAVVSKSIMMETDFAKVLIEQVFHVPSIAWGQ